MRTLIGILTIVCFISVSKVDAQFKNLRASQEYYDKVFSEHERDFKAMEAPAEYKDEPAVILQEKVHLVFLYLKLRRFCKGIIRKRILVQAESELETFTEFYYQSSDVVGIKHIKPDGTVNEIDLSAAIKVETEVPAFYRNSYSREVYYKIAIPNLEVGDIIDNYKVFVEDIYGGQFELFSNLASEYPIVSQEIIIDANDDWTVNKRAFNTSNDFVLSKSNGVNKKGVEKRGVRRYILKENDIKSSKYERWSYPFYTAPSIKLMCSSPDSRYYDKRKLSQSQIDMEEEFKGAMSKVKSASYKPLMTEFKELYKRAIRKKKDSEKPDIIYNAIKHYTMTNLAPSGGNSSLYRYRYGDLHYLSHYNEEIRSDIFTSFYSTILDKEGIDSDIILVVPEYLGGTQDAVIASEIIMGVYVPLTDTYYWSPDSFKVPGDEYAKILNSTGLKFAYDQRKSREPKSKPITIPSSSPDKNINHSAIDITVNDDNSLVFDKKFQLTGLYKKDYNSLLLYHTFFAKENVMKFITPDLANTILDYEVEGFSKKSARKMDTTLEELANEVQEHYDIRDKQIDEWIKGEYRVDEILDFEDVSYGTSKKDKVLEVRMQFNSKDYIKKAGPNLIFDIGALISDQVDLSEKEINERKNDAFINFEKTITNDIKITLPSGLTAHGLDALQFDVDNAFGTFKSVVTQEGNTINMQTTKVYKQSFIPVADWNKLTEMLEAAYQFTQQKVILKK